jgi:uncharacterized membrane protein YjjP (DUF1212 family)
VAAHAAAPPREQAGHVRGLLLELGVALAMTGDAVSEIEDSLRAVAAGYGFQRARVSVLPTLLIVALQPRAPASLATIDSARALRLDQAAEVIRLARTAAGGELAPAQARDRLREILATPPRFGVAARVAAHAALTVGLALLIRPAAADLWAYVALGGLVGAMKAGAARLGLGGYLLPVVAAVVVGAIAFLAHGGDEAASLRLTIPPLVTFLPGALLAMGTVDLAMGETVTGASRFMAGLLQLALLGIGIVIGGELAGNPHGGPVAGPAQPLGAWAPWAGVLVYGCAVYVHDVAPRRALPWLLIVLLAAYGGQLAGQDIVDSTLSGFVGGAVMVPVAHLVGRARSAPPAHVMFLPGFWLLVPGTIGLIGIAELVGDTTKVGTENFLSALVATASVALGILAGTLIVRAARIAWRTAGQGRITRSG